MQLKYVFALVGIVTVVLIIILSITIFFLKEEPWCNKDLNAGVCELYDEDSTCYCINNIVTASNTPQTDVYVASEGSCQKLGGHLATAGNAQLLKWLAKRVYLMEGVDDALIGLRNLDSVWYWMEPDGPVEATDLLWREDVKQNEHLRHASIDVRTIIKESDDNYFGYIGYNYDFYIDSDTDFQWYGLVRTDVEVDEAEERYFICHYTSKASQKIQVASSDPEETQTTKAASSVCQVEFMAATPLTSSIVNLCNIVDTIPQTKHVLVGNTITMEMYNMTLKQSHSSVQYSCTPSGWFPEAPICVKMTEAILLIGGTDDLPMFIQSRLTLYIPNRISAHLGIQIPEGRQWHTSVVMSDGTVMVTGGVTSNQEYLSSSFTIDVNVGKVSPAPDTNVVRMGPGSSLLNHVPYVCGGFTNFDNDAQSRCETYDGYKWSMTATRMTGRQWVKMVELSGCLYMIGGALNSLDTGLTLVERYSADTGEWEQVESMIKGRKEFGAAVINGIIYVCGGTFETVGKSMSSCEQFVDCDIGECDDNTVKKVWKPVADMNIERHNFELVSFEGRLYALGGAKRFNELSMSDIKFGVKDATDEHQSVESYEPVTNKWTIEDFELPIPTQYHSAVVLPVIEGIEQLLHYPPQ